MKNVWTNRNVFVTGAAGFLGSHLCDALSEAGANVVGLVRDDVPNAYFVEKSLEKKITVIHGDLADTFLLERILNEYEIDICFHLGAQPLVGIANRGPRSTFESNIRGTWNLLEAARRAPLPCSIVVASSDKAYGDSAHLPYTEEQPLAGKNPYDLSKTCTDLLAQSYVSTYNLPITISRCGNFYGPGDLNWSRIMPGTFRSLLQGERPIIRSDGTLIRDYFFIKDVVSAYLMLGGKTQEKGVRGEAFNFGSGEHVAVLDVVKKMQAVCGRTDLVPEILGKAPNEIAAQYLSFEKASRVLGWKPTVSLDEGLKQTYVWYKKHLSNEIH